MFLHISFLLHHHFRTSDLQAFRSFLSFSLSFSLLPLELLRIGLVLTLFLSTSDQICHRQGFEEKVLEIQPENNYEKVDLAVVFCLE